MRKFTVIALATVLTVAWAGSACADSADDMRKVIREHPEIVLDFLREHKVELFEIVEAGIKAKREDELKKRRSAELARPFKPVIDPARIVAGKPDAPVTIVEYSDFLCSFCARGAKIVDELMAENPDRIRLIYKHNPHGKLSSLIASYYEALMLQGRDKAKKFHDLVFANQDAVLKGEENAVKKYAAEVKADMAKLAGDLKAKTVTDRLDADAKEAAEYDFTGTPAYLVNGVSIRGAQPPQEFEEIIKLTEKK